MIPAGEVVDLSRLQFALTALYHFFVRAVDVGIFSHACHNGNGLCNDG